MANYIVRICENATHAITLEAASEDEAQEMAEQLYIDEGLSKFSSDEFDWYHLSTYKVPTINPDEVITNES